MNHSNSATDPVRGNIWAASTWIWSLIFYITLIVPTTLVLTNTALSSQARTQMAVISILFALWYAGQRWVMAGTLELDVRLWWRVIFALGNISFFALLLSLSEAYYFLLFSLYAVLFSMLPLRPAIGVSLLLTGMVTYYQARGELDPVSWRSPSIWYFLVAGVAAIGLALFIDRIIKQSAQRLDLIRQLEKTQAELAAAERREGILQERARLAHEIHDTLAQGFMGIIMHLEAADQAHEQRPELVAGHIVHAQTMAREGLSQARRVVQDLQPEILESSETLPQAIERVVAKWASQGDTTAQSQLTGNYVPLHPQAEVTLLRATQEALANIRKHAQAETVQVTLSYIGDQVILDIEDDGIGIAAALPPQNGGWFWVAGDARSS